MVSADEEHDVFIMMNEVPLRKVPILLMALSVKALTTCLTIIYIYIYIKSLNERDMMIQILNIDLLRIIKANSYVVSTY